MRRKQLFLAFIICSLAGGMIASSCSSTSLIPASSNNTIQKTIKIGLLLPLTGPYTTDGKIFRKAMELALDMDNWQIGGYPVKLVIEDEGGQDPAMALEKAKKLVQSDKVNLMLGPYNSSSALTVLPYTSSLPVVNIKWSKPISNKSELANSYAFWTSPMSQDITYPLGLYIYRKGIQQVTILGTNETLALDYIEGFKTAFKSQGGKIAQEQWAPPGETDFTRYLSNLSPATGFVCAILGYEARTALLKQYEELGLYKKMPVFLAETGTLSPETLQALGDDIIGITGVEGYLPEADNAENARYTAAYLQKYGEEPPGTAVNAYNCMRVVIEALKSTAGNTDPNILKAALLNLNIELPTGPFRFSEGRVGIYTLYVREVVNESDHLGWKIKQEYPLIETHQRTYP
jgi:branched-chain amino acid transport system substrate-binding protein